MSLKGVFNVFSRSPEAKAKPQHDIPLTARNRILIWWSRNFESPFLAADLAGAFWSEIRSILEIRHGTKRLSKADVQNPLQDAIAYVLECPGDQFLDFLADIFRTRFAQGLPIEPNTAIDELNELLSFAGLPYYLTRFDIESRSVERHASRAVTTRIVAYPRVAMRDSEVLHQTSTEPALTLLRNSIFVNANMEFLNALEDFRKGDYSDCLTKSCAAFESFMKVLCHSKGWPYNQTDTAGPLIRTIIANLKLESYFDNVLMIVATLRNRLSSSHGAGVESKRVSPHMAQYALNTTASVMVMLAAEAKV